MQDAFPHYAPIAAELNWQLISPELGGRQSFAADELAHHLEGVQGAIVGDDPVNRLSLSRATELKAICKWGVGVDAVDRKELRKRKILFDHTPGMFGREVADVAFAYLVGLTRQLFAIDKEVRLGHWPKPRGYSLSDLTTVVIGFGDIGSSLTKLLTAANSHVRIVETSDHRRAAAQKAGLDVFDELMPAADGANTVLVACPLTQSTHHLVDLAIMRALDHPSFVVNVSRGEIVRQSALVQALKDHVLDGVAMDVFEEEPLPTGDFLLSAPNVILGSHNASNTVGAVKRASMQAITKLSRLLDQA